MINNFSYLHHSKITIPNYNALGKTIPNHNTFREIIPTYNKLGKTITNYNAFWEIIIPKHNTISEKYNLIKSNQVVLILEEKYSSFSASIKP